MTPPAVRRGPKELATLLARAVASHEFLTVLARCAGHECVVIIASAGPITFEKRSIADVAGELVAARWEHGTPVALSGVERWAFLFDGRRPVFMWKTAGTVA